MIVKVGIYTLKLQINGMKINAEKKLHVHGEGGCQKFAYVYYNE